MSLEQERERLLQTESLAHFRREMSLAEMVTVYQSSDWDKSKKHSYFIYCALVPSSEVDQALSSCEWLYLLGDSVGCYRFDDENDIGPLIIGRSFHGMRDSYVEVREEFRLFHNLYYDDRDDRFDGYIKLEESGNKQIVAVVDREPGRVQIRLKEIRQFLAVKEMHLAIQFDYLEFSEKSLEELGLSKERREVREDLSWWRCSLDDAAGSDSDRRTMSVLRGLRLIEPLPESESDLPGFVDDPKKRYIDFIIGMDDDGDEIEHTCDQNALENYFGRNPGAPHELTPVSFRKEVLDKYYRQSSKYSVSVDTVECGNLWSIHIDSHHDDKVCVWLVDLGTLPYDEQFYWRSCNFASESGVSESFYRQQIHAEFTSSDRPEHIFQHRYGELARECQDHLGWSLLLPLEEGDEYHIQNIRIPATDEQPEFDELVLGLTKILVDSLNEKELNKLIPSDQRRNLKGSIARLEAALAAYDIQDADKHIVFLRDLQHLRSAGAAHRKGRKYRRAIAPFTANSRDLRTVFAEILVKAILLLDYLIEFARRKPGIQPTTATNSRG